MIGNGSRTESIYECYIDGAYLISYNQLQWWSSHDNTMKAKLKKVSNYENFDDWVSDLIQQDPNGVDNYVKISFEEFLKDGDEKALLIALRQAAKAQGGFGKLASKTGIKRESLYRALSENGNPRLNTLAVVINALGYSLSIRPMHRVG